MAPQVSLTRPHPVLHHMPGSKVYHANGVLFDEIDIAGLLPRMDNAEPAYHNRKKYLKPKVEEPDWSNVEEAKTWLEQRFTGSVAKGSPLLQYMIASRCWSRRLDMPRENLSHKWLSWSLSDGEYNRYLCEDFDVEFIEKPEDHLPLYPEYGQGPIPLGLYDKPYKRRSSSVDSKMSDSEDAIGHLDQSLLNEGDWDDPSLPIPDIAAAQMMEYQGFVKDHEVVKTWLERRYRANDAALGSPMFQFMKEFYAKAKPQRYGSQSMCQYLSFKELYRWSIEGNYQFVFYNRAKPLYPDAGMWPEDGGTGLREERERLPVVRNRRSRKSESSSQQHKGPKKQTQTGKVKEEAKEQRKDQPAYIGRLRAGVSKRSHEKSGLVCLEFKGRKAGQVKLR